MGRILGLDIGTNSIGWAIVNENRIENMGTYVFPNEKNLIVKNNKPNLIQKLFFFIKSNLQSIVLISITSIMFLFSFIFPLNWQFWINLSIGSLIATLTFNKK